MDSTSYEKNHFNNLATIIANKSLFFFNQYTIANKLHCKNISCVFLAQSSDILIRENTSRKINHHNNIIKDNATKKKKHYRKTNGCLPLKIIESQTNYPYKQQQ